MKSKYKLVLVSVVSILLFSTATYAGQASPTLTTSCTLCSQGESIIFSGSNYRHGDKVYLDITGPTPRSITVSILQKGTFSVYFGDLLSYAPGSYTVNSVRIKGSGEEAVLATTNFKVQ